MTPPPKPHPDRSHTVAPFLALLVLLIAFAGTLAGCQQNKPELSEANNVTLDVELQEFTEPENYENGIGLHASARNWRLIISVRNRRENPVEFYATDFALITGPSREDLILIDETTADLRTFYPYTLEPGQAAVIQFTLKVAQSLQGTRLVYNNPRQEFLASTPVK